MKRKDAEQAATHPSFLEAAGTSVRRRVSLSPFLPPPALSDHKAQCLQTLTADVKSAETLTGGQVKTPWLCRVPAALSPWRFKGTALELLAARLC